MFLKMWLPNQFVTQAFDEDIKLALLFAFTAIRKQKLYINIFLNALKKN